MGASFPSQVQQPSNLEHDQQHDDNYDDDEDDIDDDDDDDMKPHHAQ